MTRLAGLPVSNAVILEAKGAGAVVGDKLQAVVDLLVAHQLANMEPHMQDLQHVAGPQRVPRVEHIIVAKTDINAGRHQLLDPRHATPLRVVIKPPLQMNIHQRVGDEVNAREF